MIMSKATKWFTQVLDHFHLHLIFQAKLNLCPRCIVMGEQIKICHAQVVLLQAPVTMISLEFTSNFDFNTFYDSSGSDYPTNCNVNYGYGATACLKIQDTFIDGMHDFIMILGSTLKSNGTDALVWSVR